MTCLTTRARGVLMNKLNNMVTYVAGPIDFALDNGVGWRKELKPWLENLGVKVLDPTDKPEGLIDEQAENLHRRRQLKEQGRYYELSQLMKRIRCVDLRMCDKCDFVIIYLDLDVIMTGTIEESSWCNRMKKPCLIVCKQGKKNVPDWWYGILPYQHIFSSFDELKEYLLKINNGKLEEYDKKRWIFFNES